MNPRVIDIVSPFCSIDVRYMLAEVSKPCLEISLRKKRCVGFNDDDSRRRLTTMDIYQVMSLSLKPETVELNFFQLSNLF